MSIPTDRLREIAAQCNPRTADQCFDWAIGLYACSDVGMEDANKIRLAVCEVERQNRAIATELLACREERDAARAEAEKLRIAYRHWEKVADKKMADVVIVEAELAAVKRQRDELLAAADQVADALRDVAGAGHLAYLDAFDAAAAACAAEQPKPQQPEGGA